jgi:L-fuculose-phosphate aldolase
MQARKTRQEVVETLQQLSASGLVIGTAGNVSIKISDTLIAISPSSTPYETMSADDVCLVDLDGVYVEGQAEPSSEMQLHLSIFAARDDVNAIVHTHSKAAVAVSTVVVRLPPHHYYINQLGGSVAVAPYYTFGTRQLGDAVTKALAGSQASLMSNHGAVTVGGRIAEALYRASLLEWLCETWLLAGTGGRPRLLTETDLRAARERRSQTVYDEMACQDADGSGLG